MGQPKWKQFEELVVKIQADLAGDAIVTHNDKIMGRRTGIERQVDVSIRGSVGQYEILIVIECKDHGRPLDVKDVEEFIGLAQDVGANRAAMVAAKGFSEAAMRLSQSSDIELYRVVDTGDHPWKTRASVPALLERTSITEIGISSVFRSRFVMDAEIPVDDIELFDLNENLLGKFGTLIHRKWDREEELRDQVGLQRDLEIVPNPVKLKDYKGVFHEMDIYASIHIEKRLYFGHLRLTEVLSGLYNVVTGATIAKEIVTEGVGPDTEKKWTRIQSLDDLAVRPVMTFKYTDCYGTDADADEQQETDAGLGATSQES